MYPFPKLLPLQRHVSSLIAARHHFPGILPIARIKNEADFHQLYVKEKLRHYVAHHTTQKDRRLLECHAHCFISVT